MRSIFIRFLAAGTPLALFAQDICDWKSDTAPVPLRGHEGNNASDYYWFEHLSDVDEAGQIRQWVWIIKNLHQKYALPAEWVRGNGEVIVRFTEIESGACASNDIQTTNQFAEDASAFINFGPKKDLKKSNASLYFVAGPSSLPSPSPQPSSSQPASAHPRLKSCLKANLRGKNGRTARLHLEFQTVSEGQDFGYAVTNRGGENIKFQIPALTEAWEAGNRRKHNFNAISQWKSDGNAFLADANNEPATQVLRVEGSVVAVERQVPVEVTSDTGEPLATGQVTVYLPQSVGR